MKKEELLCSSSLEKCGDLGSEAHYYHDKNYFYKVFDVDALDLELKEKKCRWLLEGKAIDELIPLLDLIWEEEEFVGHVTRFLPSSVPVKDLWVEGLKPFYEEALFQTSCKLQALHESYQIFVQDMHFQNVLLDQKTGELYFADFDSFVINRIPSLWRPTSMYDYFEYYTSLEGKDYRDLEQDSCRYDKLAFLVSYLEDTVGLLGGYTASELLEQLEQRNFTQEGLRIFEKILIEDPRRIDLPYFHEMKKGEEHPSLVLVR